jgi:glycosyltransferase involved in cell wall biosynthesis
VPGRAEAAAGLFVLESLAAGVPVVAPACGVYPELLGATGGGLLFAPGNLDDLTSKLQSMLCEPDRARRIGLAARQVVIHDYSAAAAARQLLAVLEPLAGKGRSGRTP